MWLEMKYADYMYGFQPRGTSCDKWRIGHYRDRVQRFPEYSTCALFFLSDVDLISSKYPVTFLAARMYWYWSCQKWLALLANILLNGLHNLEKDLQKKAVPLQTSVKRQIGIASVWLGFASMPEFFYLCGSFFAMDKVTHFEICNTAAPRVVVKCSLNSAIILVKSGKK